MVLSHPKRNNYINFVNIVGDLSFVSESGLIRTNKERIEHLDSRLGIVQDGLQRMEIGNEWRLG